MPPTAPSIFFDYEALCCAVASHIARTVRKKSRAVLGLATGSTPLGVYEELIRLHREDNLDFSGVACFNLDEYWALGTGLTHEISVSDERNE